MNISKNVIYSILLNVITLICNIILVANDNASKIIITTVMNSVLNNRIVSGNKTIEDKEKKLVIGMTVVNILSPLVYLPFIIG